MNGGAFRTGSSGGTRGFTLLEMTVALAVFAVAVTIVFAVFLSQHRSLLAQEENARMQGNIRTGMERLERDLRSAGYGFPPGGAVRLPRELTGGIPVVLDAGLGVADGGTSASDNLYLAHRSSPPTRLARDAESHSPELQVTDPDGWKEGDVGIVSDGSGSEMFRVRRVLGDGRLEPVPERATGAGLSRSYSEGSSVARIEYAGYFVGTDPKGGHTALYRIGVDSSGATAPRVVAEDIEDLQVRVRIGDGTERDCEGSASGTGLLGEAVGARVHLAARVRSPSPEARDGPPAKWNRVKGVSLPANEGSRWISMEGYFAFRNRGNAP